ncbi:MAG: S41 family peptidase [Flavobacteriales bacterium]|nr:S41 family peptidase [Flavobacteriales bacterium]
MQRPSISPLVPLLVSLALVAGLFLGHGSNTPSQEGRGSFFLLRNSNANDKVQQVLDLIDRQYVDTVRKQALVEEVIQDMLQRLDPHSYYISAEELRAAQEPLDGSFDGIGVEFSIQNDTVVVIAPVEGGPSEALGILAGDRILRADGRNMAGVGITNQDVMDLLRGPSGSMVTVDLLRRGKASGFQVEIQRGKVPINSVAVSLLDEDGTGYIKLIRFARTTHDEFLTAAQQLLEQGMQRLVLDLRGNGGGYLNAAISLADEFLPEGSMIVYTQGRAHPKQEYRATDDGLLQEIPLAILIDEGSASASEIVAGAVQDNDRGLIVGRRSFGKGLVQEHMDLPDQSALRLTTARYYTPSGRSIQRPYGSGIEYGEDLQARMDHGEFLSADSMRVDSSQLFRTRAGRAVFGGGGIMPDLFVPADTAGNTNYLSDLFFSGTLNRFAFEVADAKRQRLIELGDPKEFKDRFVVDKALLNELQRMANEQGIHPGPGEMQRSSGVITERLKANIARNIWGAQGYYGVLLGSDSIYMMARERLAIES